jgi:hypothetical protein
VWRVLRLLAVFLLVLGCTATSWIPTKAHPFSSQPASHLVETPLNMEYGSGHRKRTRRVTGAVWGVLASVEGSRERGGGSERRGQSCLSRAVVLT